MKMALNQRAVVFTTAELHDAIYALLRDDAGADGQPLAFQVRALLEKIAGGDCMRIAGIKREAA